MPRWCVLTIQGSRVGLSLALASLSLGCLGLRSWERLREQFSCQHTALGQAGNTSQCYLGGTAAAVPLIPFLSIFISLLGQGQAPGEGQKTCSQVLRPLPKLEHSGSFLQGKMSMLMVKEASLECRVTMALKGTGLQQRLHFLL